MKRISEVIDRLLYSAGRSMPPAVVEYVLSLQFASKDIARLEHLSGRIGEGAMSREMQDELEAMVRLNNALMLLKAKAATAVNQKHKPAA